MALIQELDPKYTAKFFFGNGKSLLLPLPKSFNLQASSNWEAVTEAGLLDAIGFAKTTLGPIGATAAEGAAFTTKVTNSNAYISSLSHQYWKSTNPIGFTLQAELMAWEDAKEDVMLKIQTLMQLVLPTGTKNTGNSDVKKTANQLGADVFIKSPPRDISLAIGLNILFPAIIITNVSTQFETKCDAQGNFIAATVDIGVRTSYVPTSALFQFSELRSTEEANQAKATSSGNANKQIFNR